MKLTLSSIGLASLIASFIGSMMWNCLDFVIKIIKKIFWIRKIKKMGAFRKAKGIPTGQYLTPIEGLELDKLETARRDNFDKLESSRRVDFDNCERARRKLR